MTYNILTGGYNEDGTDRFDAIVSLIREQRPDILTLNECNHFERDGYKRFYAFERALGLRGVLGLASSGFHVAVFSKGAEFIQHEMISDWVQHAILRVKMRIGGEPFTAVSAHLCPFGGEIRLSEAQYLAGAARYHERTLVAGDMNALAPSDVELYRPETWAARRRARHWLPGGGGLDTRAIAVMEDSGLIDLVREFGVPFTPTALTPLRAEPSSPYSVRIDYLFASPPLAAGLSSAHVVTGELADVASDHYAVVADV